VTEDKQIKQAYQKLADSRLGWNEFLNQHAKYRALLRETLRNEKIMVKISTPKKKLGIKIESKKNKG